MEIKCIKDMIRKDVPIYYRRLYTGVVVIDFNKNLSNFRIDFSIEHKPTGEKEILITFLDTVDYPIIPITKELKKYINELDFSGGLPD